MDCPEENSYQLWEMTGRPHAVGQRESTQSLRHGLFGSLVLLLLLLPLSLAAQEPPESAILPDRTTAQEAEDLIQPGTAIRLFCEPCGDRFVQEVRVTSISAEEHPDERDPRWVIRINDAYLPVEEIYLRQKGEWRSLAHLLGLDPTGIPETIYPFFRAQPIPPEQ